MLETFQAMIGGKLAPLTIMNNEDTDLDSRITTFNTAVTETASEILGKLRQKKTPWVTSEILDLCDKRRALRKERFKPEGSEKYKEINNNIKRCMKKANVGKNSKRAIHIPSRERLDHCETGESDYFPRSLRKMPHRRATDTEPMDRILL